MTVSYLQPFGTENDGVPNVTAALYRQRTERFATGATALPTAAFPSGATDYSKITEKNHRYWLTFSNGNYRQTYEYQVDRVFDSTWRVFTSGTIIVRALNAYENCEVRKRYFTAASVSPWTVTGNQLVSYTTGQGMTLDDGPTAITFPTAAHSWDRPEAPRVISRGPLHTSTGASVVMNPVPVILPEWEYRLRTDGVTGVNPPPNGKASEIPYNQGLHNWSIPASAFKSGGLMQVLGRSASRSSATSKAFLSSATNFNSTRWSDSAVTATSATKSVYWLRTAHLTLLGAATAAATTHRARSAQFLEHRSISTNGYASVTGWRVHVNDQPPTFAPTAPVVVCDFNVQTNPAGVVKWTDPTGVNIFKGWVQNIKPVQVNQREFKFSVAPGLASLGLTVSGYGGSATYDTPFAFDKGKHIFRFWPSTAYGETATSNNIYQVNWLVTEQKHWQ